MKPIHTRIPDTHRNAVTRIDGVHRSRTDACYTQSEAQRNLRSAFPYDNPPPLPGDVQQARYRCDEYDRESNAAVLAVIVCVLALVAGAGWIGWHVSDWPVGK